MVLRGESDAWTARTLSRPAAPGPSAAPDCVATLSRFPAVPTFGGSGIVAGSVDGAGSAVDRGDWLSIDVRGGLGASATAATSSTMVAAPAVITGAAWYAGGTCDAVRAAPLTLETSLEAWSRIARPVEDRRPAPAVAARRTLPRRGNLTGSPRCRDRSRMVSVVRAGVSGRYSSGVPPALSSTTKTDSLDCWCSSLVAIEDRFEERQPRRVANPLAVRSTLGQARQPPSLFQRNTANWYIESSCVEPLVGETHDDVELFGIDREGGAE